MKDTGTVDVRGGWFVAAGLAVLGWTALPTSLAWGLLAEWRKGLVAPWVSHALWDVLMIVLLPGV